MKPARLLLTIALLLYANYGMAQICSGSVGYTPVFSTNFSNGLPGKSDLNYTDSVFIGQGFYSLKTTSANINPNWISITAPGNGRLVIVNSPNTPKYIYYDTVKTLCAATTYEFDAQILNLLKDPISSPRVTFAAKTSAGITQQLQYAAIGSSSTDVEGMVFTTPATGGDVILSITVNAVLTDVDEVFVMRNLNLRACGPHMTASFDTPNILTKVNACEGNTATFHLTSIMYDYYDDPFYQWQMFSSRSPSLGWVDIPGATSKDYTYNLVNGIPGQYSFRVVSGQMVNRNIPTCITYSTTALLNVGKYPIANASANTPCEGGTLTLNATGGSAYNWSGPNNFFSNKQSPVIKNVTQANAGTYNVIVSQDDCSTPASVTVAVNPNPTATVSSNVTICKDGQTTLTAGGGATYIWAPAIGLSDVTSASPVASPSVTTTYTVTAFNSFGCSSSASVTVTVIQPPVANAGNDKKTVQGTPIVLDGSVSNATSYYWTPANYLNDAHSLTPVATPPVDMAYTLHAFTQAPCAVEVTDTVFIRVAKKVVIPNSFTPNGDGINDTWSIEGLNSYSESVTQVFNRYGNIIFQSKGYSKAWDGKIRGQLLPFGTYYYKIDLKNGTVFAGWITIVR